jgi:pectin methylesterase-like acyl-CoA thioesterase/acetyl esterase/lipase
MQLVKILFVLFFTLYFGVDAFSQKKVEYQPYTIATTYEKLKKDNPFISPIEALKSDKINAREDVVYREAGNTALKADVYFPKNYNPQIYPGVLLIHGGGWATGSKENQRIMAQHLAQNGYVAVTAAYRLSGDTAYPAAVIDLKAAIRWMRENAEELHINPDKIAVLGASSGAQLATLIGVTPNSSLYREKKKSTSDEVQAIINIDGIVSFIHPEAEESAMAGEWLGGLQDENPKNWQEASPLEYVNKNSPPTLFINSAQPRFHAGRDDMVRILENYNIYNEVHTIPGTPHSFWHMHPWFEITGNYTVNFLNKVFEQEQYKINNAYREIVVAKDGSGDFEKIQEALNSTRDLGPGEVVIHIKKGIYREKLVIPTWKHQLTLIGEDRKNTVITNDDHSGKIDSITQKTLNTFTSYTVLIQGNDIHLKNLSIENTWCKSGQAVALHVEGDRFIAENCDISGCQDTLYAATENSRQLYINCTIEGTTDFIFGQATAVFQNCIIKSLKDSYITAAATTSKQEFGFVFLNSKLIAEEGVSEVYLGRPWRPYAKTVFIRSELGKHIVPEGWDPWKDDKIFPEKEKTAYYAEYKNSGKGASAETRVSWSHQLTSEEAKKYSVENILGGSDHWNPFYERD